jgi:class 3 adenylate cyclase
LVKGKKYESDFKSPIHRGKEKQQVELLLQFLESSKNYCVCIVDMVGSTSIAEIASRFGATVVKNIGDSLLYYFPKTDSDSNEPFKDVLKCSMAMIQKRPEINARMHLVGLPDVSYRISCEYGSVIIAKMSTSSVNDIFGNSVNLCSKINLLASPNSTVIGKGLYQKTKSFNEYVFTKVKDTRLSLGRDYEVYSLSKKN